MRLLIPGPPRILSIASTLIVASGYAFQVRPAEERIVVARSSESVAVDHIARDERALAERERISGLARRIGRDLHGLRASASESTSTLLDELERLARRDGLAITSIQPGTFAEPVTAPGATSAESLDLPRDDFEVTARGRFRAALSFLSDLPALSLPTSVSDVDLDRARGASSDALPELEATFRLRAFHLNSAISLSAVEGVEP